VNDTGCSYKGSLVWAREKESGKLLSVSAVLNGKRCNCVCPGCEWPLEAVHPKEKIKKHFRHCKDSDGNTRECGNPSKAYESIVHSFVKQHIAAQPSLYLPPYRYHFGRYRGRSIRPYQVCESREWEISDQKEEDKTISNLYTPDVSCAFERGVLAIEVYCTNSVKGEKLEKIQKDGLYVIEVDCSGINLDELGSDLIKQRLYKERYTKWLNFPLFDSEVIKCNEWEVAQKKLIDEEINKEKQAKQQRIKDEIRWEEERARENYESLRGYLQSDVERYVKSKMELFLATWKATPMTSDERVRARDCISELVDIVESRLPKCDDSFLPDPPLVKMIEDTIASRVEVYRRRCAAEICELYIKQHGARVTQTLYEGGWEGKPSLSSPYVHEERTWRHYLKYDIDSEIELFTEKTMHMFGVRCFKRFKT